MERQTIFVSGVAIEPGEMRRIDVPVGRLVTHTPMTLPVVVKRGRNGGPRLFLSACVHGDEIAGVEIIDRVLDHPVLEHLAGTLIAAPIVNVYGFVTNSRYLPDRRDLNRSFPGSPTGPLADQIANTFLTEVVGHAHAGIDLHTGAVHRTNAPQIRADLDDPAARALGEAFGAPILMHAEVREGSLRQAARDKGAPVIVYEGGEALRFDESAIAAGVDGCLRVMVHLGMLPPGSAPPPPETQFEARKSRWVRAPTAGVLRSAVPVGAMVDKGALLGVVSDPLGDARAPMLAPFDGMVVGRAMLPAVHTGDAVFNLAAVDEVDSDDGADDAAADPALWSGSRT